MVRAVWVTSSPVVPFPLVAALTSWPFSYWMARATPSYLSSAVMAKSVRPSALAHLLCHASRSSRLNALASDSIGGSWVTSSNPAATAPPTRRVGEFGSASSGLLASSPRSWRISSSYCPSVISGRSML